MASREPIEAPPRVQSLNSWEPRPRPARRFFSCIPRGVAAQVQVCGFQNADGTFSDVCIHVDGAQDGLKAAGVQELIDNLHAALNDVQHLEDTQPGPDRSGTLRLVHDETPHSS